MRIRAKFYVSETTRRAAQKGAAFVVLQPVTRGQGENAEWSQYTPSGRIEMTVTKGDAGEFFDAHLGDEFYVTFELADQQPAAG